MRDECSRSIHSSDELVMRHYVDRQHALTHWALWTGEVSYPRFSGFGIYGVVRYLDQKSLIKVTHICHQ